MAAATAKPQRRRERTPGNGSSLPRNVSSQSRAKRRRMAKLAGLHPVRTRQAAPPPETSRPVARARPTARVRAFVPPLAPPAPARLGQQAPRTPPRGADERAFLTLGLFAP